MMQPSPLARWVAMLLTYVNSRNALGRGYTVAASVER
jgi:hypothetical protein